MHDIENSLPTQRHILALCSSALRPLSVFRSVIQRIEPHAERKINGRETASWEMPILIEGWCEHPLPMEDTEMPVDERPTDVDVLMRDYSWLRVTSGYRVVMEIVWNANGWFGRIEPGAWEAKFFSWTAHFLDYSNPDINDSIECDDWPDIGQP